MRALFCGDRNWTNRELIHSWLDKIADWGYDTIIEGECQGADIIARDLAKEMGFNIFPFPAKWEEYREKYPIAKFGMKFKSAGTDRNTQMLDEGKPNLVIAFHNDIDKSKGTKNMINQARSRGIEVRLVSK